MSGSKQLKRSIIDLLEHVQRRSGGHNGLNIYDLTTQLDADLSAVKSAVNSLYLEGTVQVNETIGLRIVRLKG